MFKFDNISYGASSAVMTSLAIIIALSGTINAKISIITALLILAIADNISDSFGIHMHQESQNLSAKVVSRTTIFNFVSRLIITGVFILFIMFLNINFAVILSIIIGITIISVISYYVAKLHDEHPWRMVIRHIALAVFLMIASFLVRQLISSFAIQLVQ